MSLDTVGMCETEQRRDAFERYCDAFADAIPEKKPFAFAFSTLCYIGREKYEGPIVCELCKDFLKGCGSQNVKMQAEIEIKSARFKDGDPKLFEGNSLSDTNLVGDVVERVEEVLRGSIRLELCLPRLGRLTIPVDRTQYTWVHRPCETMVYTDGRDSRDPDEWFKDEDQDKRNVVPTGRVSVDD